MTWQLSFHSLNSFSAVIPILILMADALRPPVSSIISKNVVSAFAPKKKVPVYV